MDRVIDLLPNGNHKTYYDKEKTKVKTDANYNENGVLHGPFVYYDSNGVKLVESNYNNGALHGTVIHYINGEISMRCNYSNNSLTKMEISNPNNRNVFDMFNYSSGDLHGEFKTYTDNGNLSRSGEYLKNRYTGSLDIYFTDTVFKIIDADYHSNKNTLSRLVYNDKDGKVISESSYSESGFRTGIDVHYYGDIVNNGIVKYYFNDDLEIEVIVNRT